MNLHSIHILVTSSLLSWMKWSLGGMCSSKLCLGGHSNFSQAQFSYVSSLCENETTLKHSFPTFQACVKMKPLSSTVFSVSSLCKNETNLSQANISLFQACVKMKPILSPFQLLFSRLVKLMKIPRLFCYLSFS